MFDEGDLAYQLANELPDISEARREKLAEKLLGIFASEERSMQQAVNAAALASGAMDARLWFACPLDKLDAVKAELLRLCYPISISQSDREEVWRIRCRGQFKAAAALILSQHECKWGNG